MKLKVFLFISLCFFLSQEIYGKNNYFCKVNVIYEPSVPVEESFIRSYITDKFTNILLESGWLRDCSKGKDIIIKVSSAYYEGSSISGNRFSGYKFYIDFSVEIDNQTFYFSWSKYFSLADAYLGTLPIRKALIDLFESHELEIKEVILREVSNQ
jgi:hypothetical protein